MKLKTIYLKNFRCYKDEVCIEFDDLTTFVGKNDIGKSTILEGLEIFFNNDLVKIEPSDANIHGDNNVVITCDFGDLPSELILDSGEITNLTDEYLTISNDTLRIKKITTVVNLKFLQQCTLLQIIQMLLKRKICYH